VTGCWASRCRPRGKTCWPVSVDVVVVVDIWVRGVSLKVVEWKARPRRLVAARTGKTLWLAPVFGAYDGRSAIEVTVGPSATKSRNQGAIIPDGRRLTLTGW
jgi:hypothetical protein